MAQPLFLDPVVSSGPSLTGVGNGTLSVDRLTHFTTTQTYTLTCIATSPDTLFSVVGSLDGTVGIATVGTQFFDEDLKIFLTIQQGSTPFAIGDVFTVGVENGTDLNQDNIDDYDELTQKNFGVGVKGSLSGDQNIRYSDANVAAELYFNDLKYTAATVGTPGNSVQVQYFDTIPAVAASKIITGFLFTAVSPGAAGNLINAEVFNDVLPGFEYVDRSGNDILIHIANGITTKSDLQDALDAEPALTGFVTYVLQGSGTDILTAPVAQTFLEDGADAVGELGDEEAVVVGNLIKVYLSSGESSATQVKAAVDASVPALVLVNSPTLIGNGDDPQFVAGPFNLSGGGNKRFSFNKHEITESGSFSEGNASTRAQDAIVQGRLTVAGESALSDSLSLISSSSNKVSDVQKYLNWLIQDQKLSLRTADNSEVSWNAPDLAFADDIVIDFNDTGFSNIIDVSESPISINDGEHLYVTLQRDANVTLSPFIATNVPDAINAFRIASRFGDDLILWDNSLIRDGQSTGIGEGGSGSGSGTVRVDLYDATSTSLPTGASATIDGVSVTNGMLVLFTALSSGNNEIYEVSGVGTSLIWTVQSLFSGGIDPETGEQVIIAYGDAYGLQVGTFDGSAFLFNDYVRFFSGTDFWELSSLKTLTMTASTTADVFSVSTVGSENMIVDYSIKRGTRKETGTIHMTTDGTTVAVTTSGSYIGATGVAFSGDISGSDTRLRYTADGSSGTPIMKFFTKRWSDTAGGPSSIPSYPVAASSIPAAGADTDIQFNDGGFLGGDSDFTWDKTNNILNLAGIEHTGLIGPITLTDNTASPTTAFSYDASDYPFVIIEFSIFRDGIYQVGRILIANDTSTASMSVDSVNTGAGSGVIFSATISGTDVLLQYTTTSTGFNAQLKYSARRWA